jgi:adenylate kinase family enzyme
MKLKLVYFGSSLAGKSTNVKKLYEILKEKNIAKGDFVNMETDEQWMWRS